MGTTAPSRAPGRGHHLAEWVFRTYKIRSRVLALQRGDRSTLRQSLASTGDLLLGPAPTWPGRAWEVLSSSRVTIGHGALPGSGGGPG